MGGRGSYWSKVEEKESAQTTKEVRATKCLTDMGQSGEHQERWTV